MRKKIIIALGVIAVLCAAGATFYYNLPQPEIINNKIVAFDYNRDAKPIMDIFEKDRYWLVSSQNYSPEYTLKTRSPNKEEARYFGKLNIKVLYEEGVFVGFIAYYMVNFFMGKILFIDVNDQFRGKGYAQQLMKYGIDDMKRQGATLITLVTRTTNESAQRVYKKLGFTVSYQEDGFVYFELRV